MQIFEKYLANIAIKCEFSYGAMGRVGYLYESVKDQLKWNKLSAKKYVGLISRIGQIMALSDEDYKKEKVKAMKMKKSEMTNALLAVFGDGK